MKGKWFLFSIASFCLIFSSAFTSTAYHTITVKFTNIRNNTGKIQIQIYRTAENFKKEIPWKIRYADKKDVKNGTLTYTITGIESGVYGIAVLDDENSNNDMDYTMLIPDEGFGFSDYYHSAWSKPKFENFKFELSNDKTVTVKLRYV